MTPPLTLTRARLLTNVVLRRTLPPSRAAPRPPTLQPPPQPSLSKTVHDTTSDLLLTVSSPRFSTQYTCAGANSVDSFTTSTPAPVTKRQAVATGDAEAQSCIETYASAYGTFGIRSACDCAFTAASTETVVRTIPGSVTVTESAVVSTRRPSSQAICASSVPRTKIFPGVGNSDRQRHLDEFSEFNNASHRHHHRLHNSDRKALIPSLIMSI